MTGQPDDESLPILAKTAEPLRPVVDTAAALDACIAAMAAGSGPIAIDTERAQTYRYSAKAYVIQLRRDGAGTWLVDPVALESDGHVADLSRLSDAMDGEWVLHAASQDLPCLLEVGMRPSRLFDTELGGRLLGLPRVGLGALVESALGIRLLKEYSAVDWSTRPLPPEWLVYAALDVELLVELRDWMEAELKSAGKDIWAAEEFAHVMSVYSEPAPARVDPWRRTSGIHQIHSGRALAVVADLWTTRDELARSLDRAPSKLLPDRAIVDIAGLVKGDTKALRRTEIAALSTMKRRQYTKHLATWEEAVGRALALPSTELPARNLAVNGPPPIRSWEAKDPQAFARWSVVRPAVIALAEDLGLPVENLIAPDALRRILWDPPVSDWETALRAVGARPWQIKLVSPVLVEHLPGDHASVSSPH